MAKSGTHIENGVTRRYKDGLLDGGDLPAVEWSDGTKEFYTDGKRNRLDGPAVIPAFDEESNEYWINSFQYKDKREYNQAIKRMKKIKKQKNKK